MMLAACSIKSYARLYLLLQSAPIVIAAVAAVLGQQRTFFGCDLYGRNWSIQLANPLLPRTRFVVLSFSFLAALPVDPSLLVVS